MSPLFAELVAEDGRALTLTTRRAGFHGSHALPGSEGRGRRGGLAAARGRVAGIGNSVAGDTVGRSPVFRQAYPACQRRQYSSPPSMPRRSIASDQYWVQNCAAPQYRLPLRRYKARTLPAGKMLSNDQKDARTRGRTSPG